MKREIIFNREAPVTDIEWLETDGRGGYASSTVSLCNTRKYHGLYAVPVKGLEGRYLFLSGIEPSVDTGESVFELSNSQYPGKIHPGGFKHLEKFSDYPFPCWKYSSGSLDFTIELFMSSAYGLIIRMENSSKKEGKAVLNMNFLFSMRNTHNIAAENSSADIKTVPAGSSYSFSCYSLLPPVYISFSCKTDFKETPYWIKNTEYLKELERGFDFKEDRIMPGTFSADFGRGEDIFIRVSLDPPGQEGSPDFRRIYDEEKKKRQMLKRKYSSEKNSRLKILKEKSHHFFIKNNSGGDSIVAGYPWFGEWGRDTMISLPGLTFCCGKSDKGVEILRSYAKLIRNGLLPNTLSGTQGFESYNSVDASLLFIFAVQQLYMNVRGGKNAASEFHPAVKEILDAFLNRASELAFADDEGFITAGNEDTQLTWMDAMVDNKPVTPRSGCPVDINALWYNGLMFFIELSNYLNYNISDIYSETAEKVRSGFKNKYWIETDTYPSDWCYDSTLRRENDPGMKCAYPADTVNSAGKDYSVRPNMLWAASLPYSPLDIEDQRSIAGICRKKLLTSSGLRTLSPDDPAFQGEYRGNGNERDSKYHQGTVWPWLFGIYTEALLRTAEDKKKASAEAEKILDSFLDRHLMADGYGFVSEVFDGLNPERGKGTYAQAWSCGEIIRAYSIIDRVKRGMNI